MNVLKLLNKTAWSLLATIKRERLNIRGLARQTGRSPATIHNSLKPLLEYGLVKIERQENQHFIVPNLDNFYYRAIMRLINYQSMLSSPAFKDLERMGTVGVYGSFATGMDAKDSDIDLLMFTSANEIKIRSIINRLSRELKREINLLLLNERKLKLLKAEDYQFYMRLKLESIMFNGDIFA